MPEEHDFVMMLEEDKAAGVAASAILPVQCDWSYQGKLWIEEDAGHVRFSWNFNLSKQYLPLWGDRWNDNKACPSTTGGHIYHRDPRTGKSTELAGFYLFTHVGSMYFKNIDWGTNLWASCNAADLERSLQQKKNIWVDLCRTPLTTDK